MLNILKRSIQKLVSFFGYNIIISIIKVNSNAIFENQVRLHIKKILKISKLSLIERYC